MHAAWALGWRWPADDDRGLAERVLSLSEREFLAERFGSELPPAPATWAVAAALLAAAAVVGAAASGDRGRAVRLATWGVAGLLTARGAAGLATSPPGGGGGPYERLDLAVYSPLCLALGAGAAIAARLSRERAPAT